RRRANGEIAAPACARIESCRGVAQPGSAPALGAGGRWFESSRPDHFSSIQSGHIMREPTIFEHLGGAAALRRLAEAQYRRCLTDPILIPVFGAQGRAGHVEHLAAWLGEVFGGPDSYTRELGGHGAL